MEGLVEVVHYRPERRDEIPASGFDLYLSVDGESDRSTGRTLEDEGKTPDRACQA